MTRKWMLTLACGVVALGSTVALKISLSNDRSFNVSDSEPTATAGDEDAAFAAPQRGKRAGSVDVVSEDLDDAATRPHRAADANSGLRQSKTLRQRFVDLAAERAKRMSDDELGQAVEQITRQIADQDTAAETELNKAAEQLRSVAAMFPGTPSAERANRALEAIEAIKIQPGRKVPSLRNSEDDLSDPFQQRTN